MKLVLVKFTVACQERARRRCGRGSRPLPTWKALDHDEVVCIEDDEPRRRRLRHEAAAPDFGARVLGIEK